MSPVWRAAAIAAIGMGLLLATRVAAADPNPPEADCFEREAVTVYLHALQDRMLDHWVLPPDGMADREVVVRLRLDEHGTLRTYEITTVTSARLAQSVKLAVMHATPFVPMRGDTLCLSGRDIVTTFRNPS